MAWQELMDNAYDKWAKNWSYRQFLNNLDSLERKAVILGNFNSQVLNGGFRQYVENGYASGGGLDLLDILTEIGSENSGRVAQIVQKTLKYVNTSKDNRGYFGDYWLDEDDDHLELDDLDSEYYSFSDDFESEVEEFLSGLKLARNL